MQMYQIAAQLWTTATNAQSNIYNPTGENVMTENSTQQETSDGSNRKKLRCKATFPQKSVSSYSRFPYSTVEKSTYRKTICIFCFNRKLILTFSLDHVLRVYAMSSHVGNNLSNFKRPSFTHGASFRPVLRLQGCLSCFFSSSRLSFEFLICTLASNTIFNSRLRD